MKEEIFGPILPCIRFDDYTTLPRIVEQIGEKPLVLYVYSHRQKTIDYLTNNIQSGGVLINDGLLHFGSIFLPFGGVGSSGVGSYHGKFSFECFSHRKSVMHRVAHWLIDVPFR